MIERFKERFSDRFSGVLTAGLKYKILVLFYTKTKSYLADGDGHTLLFFGDKASLLFGFGELVRGPSISNVLLRLS